MKKFLILILSSYFLFSNVNAEKFTAALKKAYKMISTRKEKVYALINCAGIASMNLALTTPPEITKNIINTNLIGTIFANQVFTPLILKAKSSVIFAHAGI